MPNGLGNTSDQEKEVMARRQGFPSYEAMINFERQRSMRRNPPVSGGGGLGSLSDIEANIHSPGPNNALSWHPATILNYIREKLAAANGGQ